MKTFLRTSSADKFNMISNSSPGRSRIKEKEDGKLGLDVYGYFEGIEKKMKRD